LFSPLFAVAALAGRVLAVAAADRIKKALLPNPMAPRSRHVRSVLLGCPQAFSL